MKFGIEAVLVASLVAAVVTAFVLHFRLKRRELQASLAGQRSLSLAPATWPPLARRRPAVPLGRADLRGARGQAGWRRALRWLQRAADLFLACVPCAVQETMSKSGNAVRELVQARRYIEKQKAEYDAH